MFAVELTWDMRVNQGGKCYLFLVGLMVIYDILGRMVY